MLTSTRPCVPTPPGAHRDPHTAAPTPSSPLSRCPPGPPTRRVVHHHSGKSLPAAGHFHPALQVPLCFPHLPPPSPFLQLQPTPTCCPPRGPLQQGAALAERRPPPRLDLGPAGLGEAGRLRAHLSHLHLKASRSLGARSQHMLSPVNKTPSGSRQPTHLASHLTHCRLSPTLHCRPIPAPPGRGECLICSELTAGPTRQKHRPPPSCQSRVTERGGRRGPVLHRPPASGERLLT